MNTLLANPMETGPYLEAFRQEVYLDFLGFKDCPDLNSLSLPSYKTGFDWLIPVVALETSHPLETLFRRLKNRLGDQCEKETDQPLDEVIVHATDGRPPGQQLPYLFRAQCTVDVGYPWSGYSLAAFELAGKIGTNLYERLILGIWYHLAFGQNLDDLNATICTTGDSTSPTVALVYTGRRDGCLTIKTIGPEDHAENWGCREIIIS